MGHPLELFKSMFGDLWVSRDLAWRLLVRNVRAQYRQSLFGILWAFVPPVVTTATFVFLSESRVLDLSSASETVPYAVYVMTGTILWQLFVDALQAPLRLMTSSKSMLAKVSFPREALILAGLGEVAFSFLIRLTLLIGLLVWSGADLASTVWLAPVGILATVALGLMFGLLITPLGMLYTDVQNGLVVVISMWFFLTPVVYVSPTSGAGSWISTLNPVSPLLTMTRAWALGGDAPSMALFVGITVGAVMLLGFGWVLYRVAMPHLVSRMGS